MFFFFLAFKNRMIWCYRANYFYFPTMHVAFSMCDHLVYCLVYLCSTPQSAPTMYTYSSWSYGCPENLWLADTISNTAVNNLCMFPCAFVQECLWSICSELGLLVHRVYEYIILLSIAWLLSRSPAAIYITTSRTWAFLESTSCRMCSIIQDNNVSKIISLYNFQFSINEHKHLFINLLTF